MMLLVAVSLLTGPSLLAQDQKATIEKIVAEATQNSQLENLAHELLDGIGPRLVGTPQMKKAHDWAVAKFNSWGITARNEQWGEWRGWERGISHIDMLTPRVKTLEGMQLAWSPPTPEGGVTAGLVIIPEVTDSVAFAAWLPNVRGKFAMVAMEQPTGRPDDNREEHATEESFEKMKAARDARIKAWQERINKTGYNSRTLPAALEQAGAVGIIDCNWSRGFGVNKIFGARTTAIPTVDLSLEDYGMLYRLVEHGADPQIRVVAESKDLGMVPTFNTIGEIKGAEKPDEYVMLSAHFDSEDGGTGATDNGTGSILMMETMRILKKIYPKPKRTIMVGLWGSEEHGLNGSRAFVEDHPEVVENLQGLFNQDNDGTRALNRIDHEDYFMVRAFSRVDPASPPGQNSLF